MLNFGIDGYPILYTREEYIARDLAEYYDSIAGFPITVNYDDDGKIQSVPLDMPWDFTGWYLIEYRHPLSGLVAFNHGSSVDRGKRRIVRKVSHALTGDGEEAAFARKWQERVGKTFDYAVVKTVPYFEAAQHEPFLRDVEGCLIRMYKDKYGRDAVVNEVDKPVSTMNYRLNGPTVITPALTGL